MTKDIHTHRCGLHLTVRQGRDHNDLALTVVGCGYEWQHERIYNSAEDYANRHTCPACGLGPWYARVMTPAQEERVRTFIEAPVIDDALVAQATHAPLVVIAGSLLDALGFTEARFEQGERIRRNFWLED